MKDFLNSRFDLPKWYEILAKLVGFPLTISSNSKIERLDLLKHYDSNKIGTRLLFGGNVALQPAYEKVDFGDASNYTKSNEIVNKSFWLGVYPGLTKEMLDFMVDSTKIFKFAMNTFILAGGKGTRFRRNCFKTKTYDEINKIQC